MDGYWDGLLKYDKKMKEESKELPLVRQDIDFVVEALSIAREHNLEAEVVWSALVMAAEANEHGLRMDEVLEAALGEWDLLK